MPQAFEGIRVIDFSQVLAGPFAAMQISLLGAEVIKIEQPKIGDINRDIVEGQDSHGLTASFMNMNLNKRSLTLNLKTPEAVAIIKELVSEADVLVENFKAGTMEKRGLGYDVLKLVKPDLIYCSISGYGQDGPKAGEAAYDGAIQASSGMMSQTGHESTGPTRTGFAPVDMGTGLNAAFAISASLYRREQTGLGQRIDVAMMDTAVVLQAVQYSDYFNQGALVGLLGNMSPTRQPTGNVFPTSDGQIQITALTQIQVEKLFSILGIEKRLTDGRFSTMTSRIENCDAVADFVTLALVQKNTRYWLEALAKGGVPVAEVRSVPDVIEDPQFDHRGVFESVQSPILDNSQVTLVKAGYITDQDGPSIRSKPPRLGEHSEEVLTEAGFSDEEIASFRENGIV
ncbi:MAG: CaiB/BaiF CoA transferase family protein [Candidatus Azotimanducaceae bacterium]|uniref:CoA transferase n=1 Tax=OM182 bacterium TaxID=2510334 RepID=A0A520RXK5_9GAMM|nr:CoA transferase [Gammaproteobacteria bacterium]OUV67886.1 MAG: hypothetical protein CBC93_03975 [Gammaproteobacteria bacterium TMED133]RZO74914.1 MAG: CoA transferase [OM182 bacterium]